LWPVRRDPRRGTRYRRQRDVPATNALRRLRGLSEILPGEHRSQRSNGARLWEAVGCSAVVLEGNGRSPLYQDAIRRVASAADSRETRYVQSIRHQFLENGRSGEMVPMDA